MTADDRTLTSQVCRTRKSSWFPARTTKATDRRRARYRRHEAFARTYLPLAFAHSRIRTPSRTSSFVQHANPAFPTLQPIVSTPHRICNGAKGSLRIDMPQVPTGATNMPDSRVFTLVRLAIPVPDSKFTRYLWLGCDRTGARGGHDQDTDITIEVKGRTRADSAVTKPNDRRTQGKSLRHR